MGCGASSTAAVAPSQAIVTRSPTISAIPTSVSTDNLAKVLEFRFEMKIN